MVGMADWYCNKCGNELEIVDADTMYGEFDGIEECFVCEDDQVWWFHGEEVVARLKKGERDCEAKMR